MARDDILSKIKAAEAEARASVQRAMDEKEKKIADATTEAANIVKTAEVNTQEYFEKSIATADADVKAKKESILGSGTKSVSSMSTSASANLDKAVEYLLKEFMGLLHA
jgi:V/A-type H+-transporting ATPase subunit G/H